MEETRKPQTILPCMGGRLFHSPATVNNPIQPTYMRKVVPSNSLTRISSHESSTLTLPSLSIFLRVDT